MTTPVVQRKLHERPRIWAKIGAITRDLRRLRRYVATDPVGSSIAENVLDDVRILKEMLLSYAGEEIIEPARGEPGERSQDVGSSPDEDELAERSSAQGGVPEWLR